MSARRIRVRSWTPDSIGLDMSEEEAKRLLTILPAGDPLAKRIRADLWPEMVYVCEECGSPNVDLEAWVRFNGSGDCGGDPPGGTYCNVCDENDIGTTTVRRTSLRCYDGEWLAWAPKDAEDEGVAAGGSR